MLSGYRFEHMPRSVIHRYCPACAAYVQDRGADDGRCPRCGSQTYLFGPASNPDRRLTVEEVHLLVQNSRSTPWGVGDNRLRAGWYGSN